MIGIDLQNRKPIYEQIVERFQTLIVNGVLEPDSQMPSVRSLAMELSINPNTIQKAYSVLEQEGYIYPVKGRGNFVSANKGLKRKKQEDVYQSLQQLVQTALELEIDCETFVARARSYYDDAGTRNEASKREGWESDDAGTGTKTDERSEKI
jgi:GntR family transcriptional regulator